MFFNRIKSTDRSFWSHSRATLAHSFLRLGRGAIPTDSNAIAQLIVINVLEVDAPALVKENVGFFADDLVLVGGLADFVVVEVVPVLIVQGECRVVAG